MAKSLRETRASREEGVSLKYVCLSRGGALPDSPGLGNVNKANCSFIFSHRLLLRLTQITYEFRNQDLAFGEFYHSI